MKALFIGGTGTISTSITELAVQRGWDVTLLNRGNGPVPQGVRSIRADINDEAAVTAALAGQTFDVVADFIVFTTEQLERDLRLFTNNTRQYIFISTASAYQKPCADWLITESTPMHNPYWQYSRDKIACEERLLNAYRNQGFPMTIVRPSHTYSHRSIPVPVHGGHGSWQVIQRIRQGKPVIVCGDGTSLWTLTHARDFAVAFLGLMGQPKAIGQAYTITSDEQLTWNQVMEAVGLACGVESKLAHISTEFLVACNPSLSGPLWGDKSNSVVFDNSKIKRLAPEFICTTRFAQGVAESVAWLDAHPEAQRPDPDFDDWCDRVIAAHEAGKRAFVEGST
ncbi:MAG: SDR family oxidoreductase [Clostridia bacterium]|nr:SDR family oxidoreductase [Clostridia bacterium]